ncbi:hypothetical protein [Nostoc sp. DedVER01b]|uniref:hypothetical protein n=1 Tax=Nostoc sp. DedVER01b TaxID=3075404 RepID=UPI002AD2F901|nr:hypothetical protein [Nostoc sp. DedVER01b]MDZ8111393.1 hypothetical protein [Nostoc sp. DedVER01b]
MIANPCLQAIVEAPSYKGEQLCPWTVADYKPFSRIQLYSEMTDWEVGLIFAQLVDYNSLHNEGNANDVLYRVIESKKLILPGGLQVRSTADKLIYPSCCCGLEEWREWLDFLATGRSPWLGHDPSPWIEMVNGFVRVWSDGGMDSKGRGFHLDFEQSTFKTELRKVQHDLSTFLIKIEDWANGIGFPEPNKLSSKFDECFAISHKWSKK